MIPRLSYEASESDAVRDQVESSQAAEQRALATLLKGTGMPRAYTLRHEFVEAWQRFMTTAPMGRRPQPRVLARSDGPALLPGRERDPSAKGSC